MTSESCGNGTERCAEALATLEGGYDIVVNLQGDAPLTPHWFVEDLISGLRDAPDKGLATPVLRCDGATLNSLLADRKAGRVGGTTAVFGRDNNALYFSKEVLPYPEAGWSGDTPEVWHHVGVYAYRPDALKRYMTWPTGTLEAREGLEQLRFLENDHTVACVEVDGKGRLFWELNNPVDVARIEAVLMGEKP